MFSFGRLKRILPSVVHTLVKPCSSLALFNCSIFLAVRLSVMLTPVPFNFILLAKAFFLVLYLVDLTIIGLGLCPSFFLPILWDLSISFSVISTSSFSFIVLRTRSSVSFFIVHLFFLLFHPLKDSCHLYCSCRSTKFYNLSILWAISVFFVFVLRNL